MRHWDLFCPNGGRTGGIYWIAWHGEAAITGCCSSGLRIAGNCPESIAMRWSAAARQARVDALPAFAGYFVRYDVPRGYETLLRAHPCPINGLEKVGWMLPSLKRRSGKNLKVGQKGSRPKCLHTGEAEGIIEALLPRPTWIAETRWSSVLTNPNQSCARHDRDVRLEL